MIRSAGNWLAGPALAMLAGSLVLAACRVDRGPAEPVVQANRETLVGAYGSEHPRVASFKGMPFAAPPIGELRWQAPLPHPPRAGVQRAVDYAAACYQGSHNSDWYRQVGAAFGVAPSFFSDPPFSEDCLHLNVWTPTLNRRAALPVMVWIHGGGNQGGWSYEPNYRGERLSALGNVVVVSISYRLGIFGFFGHPELRGSPAPANFGLLDQLAALRWVRDQISQFGGDPANVTVFGESAGAANIGYLITSPLARGLFNRAISQSGGYQMHDDLDLADAERMGRTLARALPGQPDLAALRQRSSAEILEAARSAIDDDLFAPVVDGRVLTLPPAVFYRRHGVPYDLMIGTNEDEWYMYVDGDPGKLVETLNKMPPGARAAMAGRAAQEPDVRHGHERAITLSNMVCPAYLMAASESGSDHRAWVYRFTRVRTGPGGEAVGAYHGAEIPYVFDTHDSWLPTDQVDADLTAAMVSYWTNFARTGDPNGTGLARWPGFSGERPQVLELGSRIAPMAAPDAEFCERVAGSLYPGWSR